MTGMLFIPIEPFVPKLQYGNVRVHMVCGKPRFIVAPIRMVIGLKSLEISASRWLLSRTKLNRQTTVHIDYLTGDIGRIRRGQKCHRRSDF